MNLDKPMTGNRLRMRLTTLAVISCLASNVAWSNPNGATVTNGSATITISGSTLTVTNSPNTIINWHDFSISTGETTQFIQQSATSAVLNRVTGGDPSLILGALQSNGRVFLINPTGIVFGAGSVVDVAGLVASTLNIEDGDFLAGKHRYNADIANPGNVVNQGNIRTPTGGFVYLIGTQVENSGVIDTPSGEAILAAGHSVEIVDSTDPSLRVQVSANSEDVNLSQLMLENDGNIFSVLNSGRVSANTVTQDKTGKIYFKSAGTVGTTSSSIVEARGTETLDGGYFQGFAALQGTYAGQFNASGRNGGFAETSGAILDLNGIDLNLRALSADGAGGHWLIDPTNITIDSTLASTIVGQLDANTSVTINTFAAGPDAGNIIVASDISTAYGSNVSLTLQANSDITINSGVDIQALSGPLNVTLNADADANGSGAISFLDDTPGSATINSNGGNIVLGGGANPLTGSATGVFLDNALLDSGNGSITINANTIQLTDNTEIIAGGALTVNASGAIIIDSASMDGGTTSGFTSVTADSLTMTDSQTSDESYIAGKNGLLVDVNNALVLDSAYLEGGENSGTTTITAGSLVISDTDSTNPTNSISGRNGLAITAQNNLSMTDSTSISDASGGGNVSISVGGTLSLNDSSDIFGSSNVSISNGAISLTDSSITAANDLTVANGGNLSMDNSTIEAQGTSTTMQVGSVLMDNDSLIEVSGDLNLTASGSYTAINNSNISVTGLLQMNVGSMNVADSSISASGNFGLSTGSLTLTDTSLTSGGTLTATSGGATTMTDSTIDANGNLNMTVGSLTMTRSTVGDASGMTPTNINIVSGGNVVLNDGSDIVADQEISMLIAGKLYLNTVGSNASHISTFSDNTIFLYFPTLFSGGFLLDGVGGVLISPFNPSTGFFTGTNLTNLAILNRNLFITYAPAGPITGVVSQTNTNTVATNPYLDPYGPRQTGPGDSSYSSDVNWSPFPVRDPFNEVRECS